MPSALVDDDFRADLDEIRTLGGELGLRPFTVTVRRRTWSGGPLGRGPGAPGSTKVDVDTVLTNQAADGSSQPVMVRQMTRQEVFASGGQLSTRDLRIGPITPAFAASILPAGGFDDTKVNPAPDGSTTEILWIVSSPIGTYGLPPGGVVCELKGQENTALHTYVILRATGRAPT